jgi:hypothetical protein
MESLKSIMSPNNQNSRAGSKFQEMFLTHKFKEATENTHRSKTTSNIVAQMKAATGMIQF